MNVFPETIEQVEAEEKRQQEEEEEITPPLPTAEEILERMRLMNNLTDDEITLLAIKGAISELPPHQEEACNALAEHIRRMIKDAGSPVGELAVALIGAELQMEPE